MTEREHITREYIRDALRCAPGSRKEKKVMRDELSRLVMQYLKENPGTDREDVEYEFGKPEEFVADVTGVSSTAVLVRRERRERRIWRGVYAALAVGIVASFAVGLNLKAQSDRWQKVLEVNYDSGYLTYETSSATREDIDAMEPGWEKYELMYGLEYDMDSSGEKVVSAVNSEDGTDVPVTSDGKPLDENYPYSSLYAEVKTKEDVENLQVRDQIQWIYGLSYQKQDYDIVSAMDEDGNYVSVDQNGKPLDEDYPVSERYTSLPDE